MSSSFGNFPKNSSLQAFVEYVVYGSVWYHFGNTLGNTGNNEENNCKPDHNPTELLRFWLVENKESKSFLIFLQ
jgi:hypothetical protein